MIKAKELNDDAILEIKVNKSYYLMAKAASFTILQQMNVADKGENYFKSIMTSKYEDLDDLQRAFFTVVLLLAEIEKTATDKNLYKEKEILEPGDKGYEEPNPDSN
jgi:hypothetical protein